MDENGQPLVEPVESAASEPKAQRSAIDKLLGRDKAEPASTQTAPATPTSREVEPGKCPNPNCDADLPEKQKVCDVCGFNRSL